MTPITCTVDHESLKLDQSAWTALRHIGDMRLEADTLEPEERLELRNCACGTTLAKRIK